MKIGNKDFELNNNNVYIMGILNLTPDSFSDGNKHNTIDKALCRVETMIKQGADIIDVGGESTRPGYIKIDEEEEVERVVPVIECIKKNFDIPVSVDTYKPYVAKESFVVGADMVNDIWGLMYDDDKSHRMAKYISEYKKSVCIMHNDSKCINKNIDILIDRIEKSIKIAKDEGIDDESIIIDPGIGFAKTYEDNLYVMRNIDKIKEIGYPLLLGTSRKSMIGKALDVTVEERLEGTIATTVYGMMKGIKFVRVHDILENKRAIDMIRVIYNGG